MKTIDSEQMRAFGVQFLQAYGASAQNAGIITGHLVDNDLKGVESQGAMRLFEYARFMVDGKVDGNADPEVRTLAPGAFLVEGNRGFGIVAMCRAVDQILGSSQPMAVAAGGNPSQRQHRVPAG